MMHWKKHFFGDKQIAALCQQFRISSAEAPEVIMEFSIHRQSRAVEPMLNHLIKLLPVLPVSATSHTKGFRDMNLRDSSFSNRLSTQRFSDFMVISINGPPWHWCSGQLRIQRSRLGGTKLQALIGSRVPKARGSKRLRRRVGWGAVRGVSLTAGGGVLGSREGVLPLPRKFMSILCEIGAFWCIL